MPMNAEQQLVAEGQRLADLLRQRELRIVFAESCTAGLVAATLARIPGISDYLCGSAVVYRNATKHGWLAVSTAHLADPGPVSQVVAIEMAEGVLARTPEADLAASVTGHLGPQAPTDQDGLIFIAIAVRPDVLERAGAGAGGHREATTIVREYRLSGSPVATGAATGETAVRIQRQFLAAEIVLGFVRSWVEQPVV